MASPRFPPASTLILPLFGLAAAAVAWRAGGGGDARVDPPRPEGSTSASAAPATGAEAYEVKLRLVDALGTARIEVQNLGAAQAAFQSTWRKMRGPWSLPPGLGGRLATTVALPRSAEEQQWAVTTSDGGTWSPEARVWNMNEGSFDQREAIFAPAPATVAFRTTLPLHARLRLAPALATPAPCATRFDVSVVDAGRTAHPLATTRVEAGEAHVWHDLDLDLDPWGGQPVELVLRTSAETPSGAPPAGAGPQALWGDPLLVARGPTRLPYNVLWIVVDALRPDVAAGLHDADEDRAKLAAPRAPLEALLPAVPGLLPSIDALAARGVHFQHAWSAAAWTRPGTLAMLTGERSSELGVDTTTWVLPPSQVARWYASDPPLLPLVLRRSGAVTAAFVNNFFMAGYAAVGVDMGFERLTDHRYRTRDTAEIERDTLAWLDAHRADRFFLFANFNSPHEPYDPLRENLARIPPAPGGKPLDPQVRSYMAEAAKDDAAIGDLLEKIAALGIEKTTLVVVTADHGETLSSAHDAIGLGNMPMRFHHAVGNFEETTRIPIVMALPGVLEGGVEVKDRVRNVDIAPTVLDVEGLEADPRMSGRSMLPLARGKPEAEPRVVISEGRATRAILWGTWRMIVHQPVVRPVPRVRRADAAEEPDAGDDKPPEDELFDLSVDPGERHNVLREHPDVVADLAARLAAGLANTPAADAASEAHPPPAKLSARFVGAAQTHRVSGTLTVGDGKRAVTVHVDPAGIALEDVRVAASPEATAAPRAVVDFSLATSPEAAVGFDLSVDPPGAPVVWQLFLDERPLPEGRLFAGPFGLPAVAAREGVTSDEAREELYATDLPPIDPARDFGAFFTRDAPPAPSEGRANVAPGPGSASGPETNSAAASKEMQQVLEEWGYAHAPAGTTDRRPPRKN